MTRFSRIVCPTDFSQAAKRAVDHAATLAAAFRAELVLLHVIPEIDYPMRSFGISQSLEHIQAELDAKAKESLAEIAAAAQQDHAQLAVRSVLRDGEIHEEILACALEEAADVIVLGTHGQSALADALLGGTAERVLRTSKCPVLAVPSPS